MPTHTDQRFDMYVFQRVDGPGLQRRCIALIRLTRVQNNETLARRKCPPTTEGPRHVFLPDVNGNDVAIEFFVVVCLLSFKLQEHSSALEDVRQRFLSRHMCKSLLRLAVVVTGLEEVIVDI